MIAASKSSSRSSDASSKHRDALELGALLGVSVTGADEFGVAPGPDFASANPTHPSHPDDPEAKHVYRWA